ncbi:hypothetical protein [Nocardiopsis halotolerans]|uniref:hypothetical protein n=1 Tax=Nocardiopsis halotolerans TaxID=124252 RepID=UPI000349F309|nr:hypothetical protein [Nocardiopsis halotolerans]
MIRTPAKILAAAAVTIATLSLTAAPASAAPGSFRVEGARIYRHADFDSDVLGLGYTSHSVNVHCMVPRPDFLSMYHMTNTTTGVTGYVATAHIRVGEVPFC